jgi:CHAT domain-containing protein
MRTPLRRKLRRHTSDPPTVPGFEQSLPEGTSLVLYGTTARSLQIFVVTRHGVTAHSVAVDRMPFITRCSAFLDALGDMAEQIDTLTDAPPRSLSRGVLGQSADLYELFVRPVERDLSTARTVLIAESTELPFLPIGSFRRNSMAGTSLIERGSVVYVLPSTMIDLPLPGGPVRDLLAFGSPGLSGRDVEYEVRDIKAAFNDARFLFGPGVSLSSLSGVHADLVHLSLDIRWDSHRPANSFIWMPDPQSTVLKRIPIGALVRIPAFPAVEIHNLARECGPAAGRLAVFPFASGSRLVVLNAAGTGRKSTKAFVEAFSTQLVGGKGVAEAYRAAMLGLLHGGDAVPAFWMPFVLWSN